jgi:hypothetical protein
MTRTLIHAIVLNADEYDEGLTFDDAGCGDYVYHALFDLEGDRCIYHEDNIHGNPEGFLEGLIAGVELAGDDLKIVEALIFLNDGELDRNYIDACVGIRRWIKEEMDR